MILLGKMALGMAGAGLAGAALLCSEGFFHVKVIEKQPHGQHIDVIAPAMLAPVAMYFAPDRALAQAAREVQPNMPAIQAALDGLRDTEDFVLVDVKEPGERVQVSKSSGSIVVDVDDAGETVHVSAPIRAVYSTIEEFAAKSRTAILFNEEEESRFPRIPQPRE